MNIVISQPRYLPALNYLQRLYFADKFVLLDNVQRQHRGVENRNKLLISECEKWITIPVISSTKEVISNTIVDNSWVEKHKEAIRQNYRHHPYYSDELLEQYYLEVNESHAYVDVLETSLKNLSKMFAIPMKLLRASTLDIPSDKKGVENLFWICRTIGADTYISGSNGRAYGVTEYFAPRGIEVLYHDFKYPTYSQKGREIFTPWLAFFDPLFNCGTDYIKEIVRSKPTLYRE